MWWQTTDNVRFIARNGEKEFKFKKNFAVTGWQFVCITYDYPTNTPTLRVNNVLIALDNVLNSGGAPIGAGGFYIGGSAPALEMNGYLVRAFYE